MRRLEHDYTMSYMEIRKGVIFYSQCGGIYQYMNIYTISVLISYIFTLVFAFIYRSAGHVPDVPEIQLTIFVHYGDLQHSLIRNRKSYSELVSVSSSSKIKKRTGIIKRFQGNGR